MDITINLTPTAVGYLCSLIGVLAIAFTFAYLNRGE